MMKALRKMLSVIIVTLVLTTACFADTIYHGSLSSPTGVEATGPYAGNFAISWDVKQVGSLFHYTYGLSGAEGGDLTKNLSHFIFQVSENFTKADISGVTGGIMSVDSPKTFTAGVTNPNMPFTFNGVKIQDFSNPLNAVIEFDSTRAPMWGDFYVRDGKDKGVDVTAWNTGGFQIGVPDTATAPIPSTILLVGAGGLLILAGQRKRHA
jgi:hypothetical protein